MDQRTTAESLFFSGCAFFLLMTLCTLARAGGDFSARPVRSSDDYQRVLKPAAPSNLLPENGALNSAVQGPEWIDKPGNNLKLGAYILAPISVAALIAGSWITYKAFHDPIHVKEPVNPISALFVGLGEAAVMMVNGSIGIAVLSAGVVTGITSLGLFIGGELKAREAEGEIHRRIEISPYINPVTKKDLTASTGVSFDGAVAGVTGRF